MAKSLRSKRKRKLRRERREKFKVKETERLLKTLGIDAEEQGEAMAVTVEEKEAQCDKNGQETREHVEVEPAQNTNDVEMDQEKSQQSNNTTKKKVNRKQLLKRLGKKRHFKKPNKICKW